MKHCKRILAGLLAGLTALGLAGCGGGTRGATGETAGTNAATPMGRWVETPVAEVQNSQNYYRTPTALADGTLVLYGRDEGGALLKMASADGGATWQESRPDWQPEGFLLSPQGVRADGALLLKGYEASADRSSLAGVTFWLAEADGTLTELPLLEAAEGLGDVENLAFFDEDTIAFTPYVEAGMTAPGTVCLYNIADRTVERWLDVKGSEGDSGGMSLNGKMYMGATIFTLTPAAGEDGTPFFYYCQNGGSGVDLVRIAADGTVTTQAEGVCDDAYVTTAAAPDGSFCYADKTGIYRLAPGGALPEQVVAAGSFAFSRDYISAITCGADGSYWLSLSGNDGYSLYHYTYDASLPAASDAETLNVWSLYESATVRAAVNAYATDAGADVLYTVAMDGEGMTEDDALRTLNTALLAGAGPDVLILDGARLESFAASGLLADLGDAVADDALLGFVAADYAAGDTTPVLPARFTLPVLAGAAGSLDGVSTLDDLAALFTAAAPRPDYDADDEGYYAALDEGEKYAFSLLSVDDLVRFTLRTSGAALIREGAVDTEALGRVMDFILTVGGHYGMDAYRSADEVAAGGAYGTSDAAVDNLQTLDNMYEYNWTDRARYGWMDLATPADLSRIAPDGKAEGQVIAQPGLCAGVYNPSCFVAVNANSAHPDEAMALVATLFGDGIEGVNQADGLPTTRTGMQAFIDRNQAALEKLNCPVTMEELLAGLDTPVVIDEPLAAALTDHATAALQGTESRDEAVRGVADDLRLYLAEQQ